MPFSIPRPPAPVDKNKKSVFTSASQVSSARALTAVNSFVSNNGVLGSVKSMIQASKAGSIHTILNKYNAHQGSRIQTVYSSNFLVRTNGTRNGFIEQTSSSGDLNWLAKIELGDSGNINGICTDSNGNITVCGIYSSSILTAYDKNGNNFPKTLALGSGTGSTEGFIVQYSSSGSVNWIAKIGGSSIESPLGICVDSNGNINIIGVYSSSSLTAYNNNGTAFSTTLTAASSTDTFIVQYSSSGNVNWLAKLGGTGYDYGAEISTDSSNNINICGYYDSSTLTAYSKTGSAFATTLSNSGGYDAFVAQYTSSGDVNWVAKIGGSGADYGSAICTDSNGNINVTGYYGSSTLTAYSKTGSAFATTLSNSGGLDTFIVQYSSSGNVNWLAKLGGTLLDIPYGICRDSNNNINITGAFNSSIFTAYSNTGSAFSTTLANPGSTGGSTDVFVAQYTSSGAVNWVAKIGGSGVDYAYAIYSDSNNNVNVTGYYNSSTLTAYNKDGSTFTTLLTNTGGSDSFITQYSSAGNVNWVQQSGGNGTDTLNGISTDSNGNVNAAGYFSSTQLTAYTKVNTATATKIHPAI
jgi:hypothetical protein